MNNVKSRKIIVAIAFLAVALAIIGISGCDGRLEAVRWISAVSVVAVLLRPILCARAINYADGGFGLSFGFGLAAAFLPAWFAAGVFGCDFATPICCASVLVLGAAALICERRKAVTFRWNRDTAADMLMGLAIFALLFAVAFWIKGFRPQIDSQTEQYMDYGFMQAMYRQKSIPPEDFWCAGKTLNYYYLGQAIAVFLCRISFTIPEYGYNLMLCTFWSMGMLMCGEIVSGLLGALTGNRKARLLGGVLGPMAAMCAGNGHYLIYGIIVPLIYKITGRNYGNTESYWFPSSTVYIGEYPDLPDKGKHEYPAYSFVLGDLHAHVINILFVLPIVAILLDYAVQYIGCERPKEDGAERGSDDPKADESICEERAQDVWTRRPYEINLQSLARELFSPHMVATAVLLGMFCGTNYWDNAIYFIVAGAIILFTDYKRFGIDVKTTVLVLVKGVVIRLIGAILMLPFNLNFEKMSSQILLCDRHSQLYKLVILWLLPFMVTIGFIACLFVYHKKCQTRFNTAEIAIVSIGLCAIGLVIMPEIVYVLDIYGEAYQRFNTMFKLTYQAFVLFGIVAGVAAGYFAVCRMKATAIVTAIMIVLLSGYFVNACDSWFGNVFDLSQRKGMSAVTDLCDDPLNVPLMAAADIINADERSDIHIVESGGMSYSDDNGLSVFTGASAYIGWYVHEWMWRGTSEWSEVRGNEIRSFYESGDVEYCTEFVEENSIDYIYVGPREAANYIVNPAGFESLGEVTVLDDSGMYYLVTVGQ